jgi:hypothetical protein
MAKPLLQLKAVIYLHHQQVLNPAIHLLLLSYISTGGNSWSQAPVSNGYWYSVASDSTGQYLAAVQYENSDFNGPGYIFTSTSGIISINYFHHHHHYRYHRHHQQHHH